MFATMPISSERPNTSMKISVFWAKTPCRPLKGNRRFGGTCHLYLRIEETKQETSVKQIASRATHSSETSIDFYQRTAWHYIQEEEEFFISTAARTSYPTSTSLFSRQSVSIHCIEDYEDFPAEFRPVLAESCGRPKRGPNCNATTNTTQML
jgi:hypothetical protein